MNPFVIDAVVIDIALGFFPYFAALLIVDGILIILIRRKWTSSQKSTSPADEKETTYYVSDYISGNVNPIIFEPTRSYGSNGDETAADTTTLATY